MRLNNPNALWYLWLVPLVIVFYAYVFRSKQHLLKRFASEGMLKRILVGHSRTRQIAKAFLVVLGLFFGVLSLTEIQYGFTWEDVKRRGVDIVIALDVSDSMLVEDVEAGGKLSRLARAKREIEDLLQMLEGDRIGLVAFSGTAFLECPLTLDYAAAEIFLEAIDTDLIPMKGTALGEAIRTGIAAFEGGTEKSRAMILITDGEDHQGEATKAAEIAKDQNVRIFAIGIGRDEGAPIPNPDGGFRKNRRGEMVLSRLDETALQKIALTTGGSYVRSVTGDVDLEKIYTQGIKATLEEQELSSKRRQRWKDRFQWFVAACMMCLALEPLIPERRKTRKSNTNPKMRNLRDNNTEVQKSDTKSRIRQPKTNIQPGLLVAFFVWSVLSTSHAYAQSPAKDPNPSISPKPTIAAEGQEKAQKSPAKKKSQFDDPYDAFEAGFYDQALQHFVDQEIEHPTDPLLLLNIGAAQYKMKNFEEAEKAFGRAAMLGDAKVRSKALYNLGNVAYRQGELDAAISFYQQALENNPEDQDAKFNLEFVRDEIRRRIEEAKKRQEQQQQSGDQGNQQQDNQGRQNPEQDNQQGDKGQDTDQDTDQDGLSDTLEKNGPNPTDPSNPDTDGDTLPDGQEDQNKNGKVDPGETDPNKKDTDGDGIMDAMDQEAGQSQNKPPEQKPSGMNKEDAERLLQSLQEDRPTQKRPMHRVQRTRPDKDW